MWFGAIIDFETLYGNFLYSFRHQNSEAHSWFVRCVLHPSFLSSTLPDPKPDNPVSKDTIKCTHGPNHIYGPNEVGTNCRMMSPSELHTVVGFGDSEPHKSIQKLVRKTSCKLGGNTWFMYGNLESVFWAPKNDQSTGISIAKLKFIVVYGH